MIYLNPKAGGLTPHPPYVPVRPFPPKSGGLMLFLLGEARRRCRVVGRRLEIAFPWGDALSGEPGELTNS
jgi:hypothetical protein